MTVRQFLMLRYMRGGWWTYNEALMFRQHTFGSLCNHGWVAWDAHRKCFFVTIKGIDMLRELTPLAAMRRGRSASRREMELSVYAYSAMKGGKVVQMRRAS